MGYRAQGPAEHQSAGPGRSQRKGRVHFSLALIMGADDGPWMKVPSELKWVCQQVRPTFIRFADAERAVVVTPCTLGCSCTPGQSEPRFWTELVLIRGGEQALTDDT